MEVEEGPGAGVPERKRAAIGRWSSDSAGDAARRYEVRSSSRIVVVSAYCDGKDGVGAKGCSKGSINVSLSLMSSPT